MSTLNKKTVGACALELQAKGDEKINPIDMQRAMHAKGNGSASFDDQVRTAVDRGKSQFEGDFFVVVLFKKERLLKNVVRQYFFPRKSCPTPEYDQVIYKYFRKDEKIDFLWVIPDKQTVIDMVLIGDRLPKDQQDLVKFAVDFNSGELDKLRDRLNSS